MASLLAASGGDTVKLFDASVKPGDPCTLSYTPSPGSHVNSVKWNHTSESLKSLSLKKQIFFFFDFAFVGSIAFYEFSWIQKNKIKLSD